MLANFITKTLKCIPLSQWLDVVVYGWNAQPKQQGDRWKWEYTKLRYKEERSARIWTALVHTRSKRISEQHFWGQSHKKSVSSYIAHMVDVL